MEISKILFARQTLQLLRKSPISRFKSTTHEPPFWKKYDSSDEFQDIKRQVGRNHEPFKHLYAMGMPLTGALGIRNLVEPKNPEQKPVEAQNTPQRIYFEKTSKLVDFDCGYGYSVFVRNTKRTNQVLGCGVNTNSQIGLQRDECGTALDYIIEPQPILLPLRSSKTKVVKVSCGRAHTVLLTDKEGVLTLGNNAFGQCGRPIVEGEIFQGSRKVHTIPHSYFGSPVVDVVCGMDHTLFLTKDQKVYSCGWGADGQTGLGTGQKVFKPTRVEGDLQDKKVVKLSTFADTCLALDDQGHVYGWGSSEYSQLGSVTDSTQVSVPKQLPFEKQDGIVDVSCGGSSCLLLDNKGTVYVWGFGILGKGPSLEQSIWPCGIPATLFGKSEFNKDMKVTSIHSGLNHHMAITNKGELFAWGKNKGGCLGIHSNQDQYFPWKVIIGSEVKKVRLGVDHSLVMSHSVF